MSLPAQLKKAIDSAYKAVLSQPEHDLMPAYRQAVYNACGGFNSLTGYRFQTSLAIITARYVLPIWDKVWPEDDFPWQLLDIGQKVYDGTFDLKAAHKNWNWEHLIEISGTPKGLKEESAIAAGMAAYKALGVSLEVDLWDGLDISQHTNDLDPWCSDVAQCAADAYSEPSWTLQFSPAKRQEFWEWWLHEAIPMAWELANER